MRRKELSIPSKDSPLSIVSMIKKSRLNSYSCWEHENLLKNIDLQNLRNPAECLYLQHLYLHTNSSFRPELLGFLLTQLGLSIMKISVKSMRSIEQSYMEMVMAHMQGLLWNLSLYSKDRSLNLIITVLQYPHGNV
jgi:hypothetical protein